MTLSFAYHEPPDVPPGMTLHEYRRLMAPRRPRRRGWRRRLLWWRRRQLRQPLVS